MVGIIRPGQEHIRYSVSNVAEVGTDTGSSHLVVQVTEREFADWLANYHLAVVDVEPRTKTGP